MAGSSTPSTARTRCSSTRFARLRSLALGHRLGHRLSEEQDAQVSLLTRLVQHARATAGFSVYYGRGRDSYDVRGRTTHEAIFNTVNGSFRGPNSQQGYSPFSTWTRGLAWAMLGFAEQLEFLQTVSDDDLSPPEYDAEASPGRPARQRTGRDRMDDA